jgi:hypothetical protein
MLTTTYTHLLPLFEEAVRQAIGTNSALIMEHDVHKGRHGISGQSWSKEYGGITAKDHSIWLRWNQPCQGGEMRKYAEVHGDECTQPKSQKPRDLHHPFPEGNPVAVGVRFRMDTVIKPDNENILSFLYQNSESPYRAGHGKSSFVRNSKDQIIGVIIEDTKRVDPTAMVNLIQFTRSLVLNGIDGINSLINLGATPAQALALTMLGNQPWHHYSPTVTYYFAEKFSIKRFLDGIPNDLSNGISFFDRGDYNRIDVQNLWMEDDKDKALIWQRDGQPLFDKYPKLEDRMPAMLDLLMTKYRQQSESLDDQQTEPVIKVHKTRKKAA